MEKLDTYDSAVGDSNARGIPHIEAFPPALETIARNPIVVDLAYNSIDFPSLENRMKKKGGLLSRFWG